MIDLTTRDDARWERIVFAEVVVPDTVNVFGDYMTASGVREFAYAFMKSGFGIDVNHDNVDVSGEVHVVEAFIARPGDPDFREGSWVVAMHIDNDQLWQDVLDNKINGYSYEALMQFFPAELRQVTDVTRYGVTEPDLEDGHVHNFFAIVDDNNRPTSGGTDVVDGHSHTISTHTVTDISDGHNHRYNLIAKETI